jgi:uncharacterized OB-fold protein
VSGDSDLETVDLDIDACYTHAAGSVRSRFLSALRDECAILGGRCTECARVVVPPDEHCDVCGGAVGELVRVGPNGVVAGLTVVSAAAPLAFVRVRLDGADTDLVHIAPDVAGVRRGTRVRPIWAAERTGTIRDIAGFEPGEDDGAVQEPRAHRSSVTTIQAHLHMRYRSAVGATEARFRRGLLCAELAGNRCPACETVFVPPRPCCPRCFTACEDWLALADRGVVKAFVVVNVPFSGQEIGIPYVLADICIDGADAPFLHLVGSRGSNGKLVLPAGGARVGMRVRAVWRSPSERRGLLNDDIEHFEPFELIGEP